MQLKNLVKEALAIISHLRKNFIHNDNKRALALRAAAVFLGLFVSITAGVGVGIYTYESRSGLIKFWSRVVPFPAGLVRWQVITYSEYLNDLIALEHFYARQREATGLPAPESGVLRKAIMDRMVRNIALVRLSREKKLIVGKEELAEQFQKTTVQVGTEEDATSLLQDLYGWDKKTFIDRILYYFLLEEKLAASYGNEQQMNDALTTEIQKFKEIRFFGK